MVHMTCDINITNKWQSTKFFLFAELPQINDGPSDRLFTNAFQTTDKVPAANDGSSSIDFSLENTFYAIFGTKSSQRVLTSSYKKITLGPNGSVVAVTYKDDTFEWDTTSVAGKSSDVAGSFQFNTDDSIPSDTDERFIGVGMDDPEHPGKVVPIMTYPAEPSLTTKIFPKMTFYIATGERHRGDLVDVTNIGKYVKVDFENSKIHSATLTLTEAGDWVDENDQSAKNGVTITSQRG